MGTPRVKRSFRPHQVPAFEYGLDHEHWAWLMEMRLGKTMVAIRTVKFSALTEDIQNILVLAPTGVLETWAEELSLEGESYVWAHGVSAQQRVDLIVDDSFKREGIRTWVLMGYEALRSTPKITALPWDVVLLDESTKIKAWGSKISQLCRNSFRDVGHRGILSGDAAPESELDLFNQFVFLDGHFMGYKDFWAFRNDLFMPNPYDRGKTWIPKWGARDRIKKVLHARAHVLLRSQAGLREEKIYQKRYVDMSPKQLALHKQAANKFSIDLVSGASRETIHSVVVNSWLVGLAGGFDPEKSQVSDTKINELMSIVGDELRREHVLVWFSRDEELQVSHKKSLSLGIPSLKIDGGTPPLVRGNLRRDFINGKYRVAYMQEACAKFGSNWAKADTAIYYSNLYSNEARKQSEDRIVDTEKKRPLLYIDLITRGSIDEDIVPLLQEKKFDSTMLMNATFDRLNILRLI
jgi:SNF2 family DNA or RNA helicase